MREVSSTIPLVFATAVVDISPTSRYEEGKPDTAHFVATALLAEPREKKELEGLRANDSTEITVGEDGRLVTVRATLDINKIEGEDTDENGPYRFYLKPPPVSLIENGDFSLIVLLPRRAEYESKTDSGAKINTKPWFDVELDEVSKVPEPEIYGTEGKSAIGGRIGVAWYAKQDDPFLLAYVYKLIYPR